MTDKQRAAKLRWKRNNPECEREYKLKYYHRNAARINAERRRKYRERH